MFFKKLSLDLDVAISDLNCIEIDSEGQYLNELKWFYVGDIDVDLASNAKQLRIRAR